MKILYFGTPSFSAAILDGLLKENIEIIGVVTKPDKPTGRGVKMTSSPVKTLIKNHYPAIPIYAPSKASDAQFIERLKKDLIFDVILVVAYGEILSSDLLSLPPNGSINLHTSLLPKFRGASPTYFTLLEGEEYGGITLIEMVKKMDAGPILLQKTVPISSNMNREDLENLLIKIGVVAIKDLFLDFAFYQKNKKPQDENETTYVTKITNDLLQIDWNRSAEQIHNQIRAFSPFPGAWADVNVKGTKKRLKILKTQFQEAEPKNALWAVQCQTGYLVILEVQLEGKKRLPVEEFLQGMHGMQPSFI